MPFRTDMPHGRWRITRPVSWGAELGHVFRLLASRGTAVVLTGHEATLLGTFSDHVTWCTAGTTYELGTPAAAFAHSRFAAQYLGRTIGGAT